MNTTPPEVSKIIKPAVLALASLAIGIVFDILIFKHQPGISVPLFVSLVFCVIAVFDRQTHRHLSVYEILLAGVVMILSLFFAVRDAEFLLGLNAFAIAYLYAMLLVSLYGAQIRKFKIWDFVLFPLLDIVVSVFDRMSIVKELKARRGVSSRVVRGTVLALIVAGIFIALFVAADDVFRELLTRALHVEDIVDLLDDILIIGIISFGTLVTLAPAFWKRPNAREIADAKPKKDFGIETAIVLGMSNLVFLGFMFVQAVYLFGGESSLESLGLTYAEYAREGFYQLLVVAIVVVAITWSVRMINSEKYELVNKVLNGFLMLLTLGVLWSSWTRLGLYESAFGFTEDRLFAHYGLVVVAVVLAILFAGLITKIKHNTILHSVVFTFAIALIGLNLLNPDAFIARQNIERGDFGNGVDYKLLFGLSDDASEVLLEHLHSPEFQEHIANNHQKADELISLRNQKKAHDLVMPDSYGPDYNKDLYKQWQAESDKIRTRLNGASRLLDAQSKGYVDWLLNFEYNDDWQSWNLARWTARNIHEKALLDFNAN